VANLLAVTLRELARDLVEVVVPGGSLVLSGMLDAQLDDVVETFVDAGCAVRAVHHRDGWAAVVLDRADPESIADDLGDDWFTDADNPWVADADD
jgi:ribosomal protein L11 methylase PrmA